MDIYYKKRLGLTISQNGRTQNVLATVYIHQNQKDFFVSKNVCFEGFCLPFYGMNEFKKNSSREHRLKANKVYNELKSFCPDYFHFNTEYNMETYNQEKQKENPLFFLMEFSSFSHLGGFVAGCNVNRSLKVLIENTGISFPGYFTKDGAIKKFVDPQSFENAPDNLVFDCSRLDVETFLKFYISIPQPVRVLTVNNMPKYSLWSCKSTSQKNYSDFIEKVMLQQNKISFTKGKCFFVQLLEIVGYNGSQLKWISSHILDRCHCIGDDKKYEFDPKNVLYVSGIFDDLIDSKMITFDFYHKETEKMALYINSNYFDNPLRLTIKDFLTKLSKDSQLMNLLQMWILFCSDKVVWQKRNSVLNVDYESILNNKFNKDYELLVEHDCGGANVKSI